MKILALEFSSNQRSVAVAQRSVDGTLDHLAFVQESFREVTGLSLIDRALVQAGLRPPEISHIIIGLGPGSYTGIRSAIAIAQGWQLGSESAVFGVSSIRCLAEDAAARGMRGDLSLVVDAQRGDVYLQEFRCSSDGATELSSLRIVARAEVPQDAIVIGPDASKILPGGTDLYPSAKTLTRLIDLGPAVPAENLEPIYLRQASFVKAPAPRQIS